MSCPTDLLPRTAIAATNWISDDGRLHIRVYTQDVHGNIRESRYDNDRWSGGTIRDVVVAAKPHSPLAVTSWNRGEQIRLYYLSQQNHVQELCWTGVFWYAGTLNALSVLASPASQLATISWNDGRNMNVYYQRPDHVIQEIYLATSGWIPSMAFSRAMLGTSLAAIIYLDMRIRLYFQDVNGAFGEEAFDNGRWSRGGFSGRGPPFTSLAAISWGDPEHQKRVFSISSGNRPQEFLNGAGIHDWEGPSDLSWEAIPASGLSAINFGNEIHVYHQVGSSQVMEQIYRNLSWNPGSIVPTE